jgi:hypothetical protein
MQFKNWQTRTASGILPSHWVFVLLFIYGPTDILCEGQTHWDATRRLALVREAKNRY